MKRMEVDNEKLKHFFNETHSDMDESYVNDVFCDVSKEKELKSVLFKQFEELPSENGNKNNRLVNILYKIHYIINTNNIGVENRTFKRLFKWSYRIAGIIFLPILVFIGIQLYSENSLTKDTWVELNAPSWTRIQFSLPDGTTGWLNSNSSIKYGGNFIFNRQIKLTGEAYFDVHKSKKKPFSVITNDIVVKVLGTRFNIATYENEKNVEVVLEEGELLINNKNNTKSFQMKPNDLVIYDKTNDDFVKEIVQTQKYLMWTEGKLVFRNDPIDVIVRRLERWYNIDVVVNGSLDEGLRLRGTFDEESLEEVLALLKRSLPIDYRIENRIIRHDDTYAKKKVIITLLSK